MKILNLFKKSAQPIDDITTFRPTIKSLVEEMRKSGWVFTYIGANQDVEAVAESMSINHRMAFYANVQSTKAMFERENMSRKRFFDKVRKGVDTSEIEDDYFEPF